MKDIKTDGISEAFFQALRERGWRCMLQIGKPSPNPIWWKNDEPATVEELQADIDAIIAGGDAPTSEQESNDV